jgi:hypothetical protein
MVLFRASDLRARAGSPKLTEREESSYSSGNRSGWPATWQMQPTLAGADLRFF